MVTAPMRGMQDRVEAIAIGASAGGVDALLQLLPHLHPGSPLVLVVVHRGPRQPAAVSLAMLLGRVCALKVSEAWSRQPLGAGEVVLAPADYHRLVDDGPVATLSVDEPVLWSRPAIDPLLESASRVFGPRLLAIVLTGASADGAQGAEQVRHAGGLVWVQDPDEAASPTMPRAVLELGGADRVLKMEAMGRALSNLGQRS